MAVTETPLIIVSDYLAMSFDDGDREYLDGQIQENNVGEWDHSALQSAIAAFFSNRRKSLGLHTGTGCRTRVSPTRFRLPDVAVILGERPRSGILDRPPFLVIEVLSPEARASRVGVRIDDYLRFGIPWILVLDPLTGRGHVYHEGNRTPVRDGMYRTENPLIEMNFFELLDQPQLRSSGPERRPLS